MNLLAHNGVTHQNTVQSAAHGALNPLLAGLLVTVVVLAIIAGLVYLTHRFSPITLPINDKEENE